MSRPALRLAVVLLFVTGCRGPVITTDPPLNAGGTIAGIVRSTEGAAPLTTRVVTATDIETGAKFQTTTGANGGYTSKVPRVGRYRLEVELRDGEVVAKGPTETEINNGDLDPGRDFEITLRASK
jgi:hypothetical protein